MASQGVSLIALMSTESVSVGAKDYKLEKESMVMALERSELTFASHLSSQLQASSSRLPQLLLLLLLILCGVFF